MMTSRGMAGVPRASLVVIAATLSSFNLPEAGLLLIIGIGQFLDMGRSATNVIGNSLATAVVRGGRVNACRPIYRTWRPWTRSRPNGAVSSCRNVTTHCPAKPASAKSTPFRRFRLVTSPNPS